MLIRKATQVDAGGIAKVRIDTWRTAYKNIVPKTYLQSLDYEAIERQFSTALADSGNIIYVAEDSPGNIAGFAFGGVNRAKRLNYAGEIYAIYVLKEHEGQGIGRQLAAAVIRSLRDRNIKSLLIWVLTDNPYRRFYQALQGRIVGSDSLTIDGTALRLTAYGWDNTAELILKEQ